MPRVEFELLTPVFERAKTVLALDPATTVIGSIKLYCCSIILHVYSLIRALIGPV
jgi:hypothetical protein